MKISQIGKIHTRRVYSIFDLMTDLGGVTMTIFAICGYLIAPVAKFSFILDASSFLFFGRIKNNNVFSSKPDPRV